MNARISDPTVHQNVLTKRSNLFKICLLTFQMTTLAKEVTCVGCRRSVESLVQVINTVFLQGNTTPFLQGNTIPFTIP